MGSGDRGPARRRSAGPESAEGRGGQVERLREAVGILHRVMGITDHAFREAVVEGYILLPPQLRDRVATTVSPRVHADYLRRVTELRSQADQLRAWAGRLPEAGVEVPEPQALDPIRLLASMRRQGAGALPGPAPVGAAPRAEIEPAAPPAAAEPAPEASPAAPAPVPTAAAAVPSLPVAALLRWRPSSRLHRPLLAAGALVAAAAAVTASVALLRPGPPAARAHDASATTVPVIAAPGLPSVRRGEAVAAGPGSQAAVLFGGAVPEGRLLDDTWVFDGRAWSEQHPGVSPPPRTGALAAYDAGRHQLVLTGGRGVAGELTDTWTWDGVEWTLQLPETPPRLGPWSAIAADATARTVVLVTGSGGIAAQTWLWDGSGWQRAAARVAPVLSGPPVMSADPLTGHVVLVTARGPGLSPVQTWTWDGSGWTARPQAPPPAVVLPGSTWMAADAAARRVLLFTTGTAGGATWLWNGSRWTYVFSAVAPTIAADGIASALVTDPRSSRPLLVGAGEAANPSRFRHGWVWHGNGWKAS